MSFLTLKRNLRRKFLELGLSTGIQSFNVTKIRQRQPTKGHNLIGIWPGNNRNSSDKESILVIGAHYDTVPNSIGIEDNASGSTAVLELARLLQKYKCSLNTTIIFVLFDMEEDVSKCPPFLSANFSDPFYFPIAGSSREQALCS